MTNDVLDELLAYHESRLMALEDMDHVYELDAEVVHPRNRDHVANYAKREKRFRASLVPALERAVPIVNDWAPAEALLRRGVEAGLITYQLGRAGEDAVDLVRGAPEAKDPRQVLSALVTSGRLVKPTHGRCARCKVTRPVDQLDAFTSATSSEIVYICHGPQPIPEDRLGLGKTIWWTDTWGVPCTLETWWT